MFAFALFILALVLIGDASIIVVPFLVTLTIGYCEGTGTGIVPLFHSLFF
jgi:hypothetical protein